MENLALGENDIVRLRSCSLPKASYVKLQPETKDFLDITNPKAVYVYVITHAAPRHANGNEQKQNFENIYIYIYVCVCIVADRNVCIRIVYIDLTVSVAYPIRTYT